MVKTTTATTTKTATPAKAAKGPKATPATEKTVKGPKAAAPAASPAPATEKADKGVSKPQSRVLVALAKAKDGLTGTELAAKSDLHPTMVGGVAGYRNPEINDRPVHSRNLLNRGYVKIERQEGRGFVYVITAAGRKAAGK